MQGGDIKGNQLYISNTDRKYNPKGSNQGRIFPKNTVCFAKYCFSKGESSLLKFDSCLSFAIYGFNSYKKISDPKFIKYCFDYPVVKHNLLSLSNSSTCHQNLTLPKLLTSLFPNPPYEIQRKIGNTLSSYDELIETLEEKIELLEIIRDSLYKEWFIKLKFPNYEKHTFMNSLPKDWKFMYFKDIS